MQPLFSMKKDCEELGLSTATFEFASRGHTKPLHFIAKGFQHYLFVTYLLKKIFKNKELKYIFWRYILKRYLLKIYL